VALPTPKHAGAHMWGGRFERGPDESFYEFERSWGFDRRLLPQELELDRAWAETIAAAGILTKAESQQIVAALDEIEERAAADPAWLDASKAEDVHNFAENELIARLGPLGAKLHTGRSRNEMIATEFRMFVRDAAAEAHAGCFALASALAGQAARHIDIPMPGMTHMQPAQPVLLSHWLLGHAEAFLRNAERFEWVGERADFCPLGSGALAGTAFPIDRVALARRLGFSQITRNSLDAVGDRDFALEHLFALSLLGTQLSRLAEDFILFATPQFGFVALPDEFSTGSSLMPQKKNPDGWELIRGKAGRVVGSLVSLLITLKGLPASYDRDLQEDKEPLFSAHDQALAMARIAAATITATGFNEAALRRAAGDPALVATEAADYLVARGIPFRDAHEIIGRAIREAEREGKTLRDFPLERLQAISPAFGTDLAEALTTEASLARHRVPGGTSPESVRVALHEIQKRLGQS
jgi:argininosuccinate lyase